jgi:lipopolysaccharide export system permease protein
MRLLTRYLTREILAYAAGTFALILGVFLVRRSAVLLAEFTEAALPIGVMSELLVLRTLMALPSLLPPVVYLAVLLALTRLNENHEIEALQACGVSRARIYRSVALLGLASAVLIGLLAVYGRPLAARLYLETKAEATAAAGTDQMRPGRFYELDWGGEQVFFADRRSSENPRFLENVFLQQRQEGTLSIHFAERALEQRDSANGRRLLAFYNGRRYDFPLDEGKQEFTEYSEMVMTFPEKAVAVTVEEEEMPVAALWRSPSAANAAELQWRLAMPLSTLVLVLLALPLCPERPGARVGARMFVALLTYVAYRQTLGTGKRWILDGSLDPMPGLTAIHVLFLVVAIVLLVRQSVRLHGGWRPLLANASLRSATPANAGGRG